MSENQNLPRQAGFKITTIDGKRCTAVPRAIVQASSQPPSSAAAVKTTAAPAAPAAPVQTSIQEVETSAPIAVAPVPSSTAEQIVAAPVASTSEAPPTSIAIRTSASITTLPTPEAISDNKSGSAIPALEAVNSSSNTAIAEIQSERRTFSTPSPSGIDSEVGDPTQPLKSSTVVASVPSSTHTLSAETTIPTLITASSKRSDVGAVVGAVLGAVTLVAIIGTMFFFCRRKRRKINESLLSPLSAGTRGKFYEIDSGSVGPTTRSSRLKQEFAYRAENVASGFISTVAVVGSSLKSKLSGERSDTPSVDLNRGNSQFFHGPISQHSRENSSVLSNHTGKSTVRDKLEDWWLRFTEVWRLQKQAHELVGPFSSTRSLSEKKSIHEAAPTFSQLVSVDDQEAPVKGHRRQTSSLSSHPNPAIPQIDTRQDPFADPFSDPFANPIASSQSQPQHWLPPKGTGHPLSNPFADPITTPAPSVPKPQTYVTDVRRSRGSSYGTTPNLQQNSNRISLYRPPSGASRYPSTIAPSTVAPSHDSDRDTFFSSYSGGRRGKGRSDPFDLERPELWRPPPDRNGPPLAHQTQNHSAKRIPRADTPSSLEQTVDVVNSIINQNPGAEHSRASANMYLRSLRMTAEQQHSTDGDIRYSSGVDSMWGDPGPDLGDRSVGSSLRGNASSRDVSGEYDRDAVAIADVKPGENGIGRIYSNEAIKGSLMEIRDTLNDDTNGIKRELERRRGMDDVSPVSAMSVEVVGKAR